MDEISVWAPKACNVELTAKGQNVGMRKAERGWWHINSPSMQHEDNYAFRIDGKGPFPDPRSPWQPEGIEGPSRRLDHSRFEWADSAWRQPPLGSSVIYELHVGTFSEEGTFDAVIERLDHLSNLGVTHIELMPVAEFPGNRGWGYDGVDLYAPHHAYGGPDGLKRLVNVCHGRGLAVILDVVYNHLGPSGNFLNQFGPYFTDRYATPWGAAVNFDGEDSDEVRHLFVDNALMWLRDYHIDALRIDAIHAIIDTTAVHFLEQLAVAVNTLEAELGRHLFLIVESDLNDPRFIRPPEAGGCGMDAQWNDDFHHALHAVLTKERNGYYRDFGKLADLAKTLKHGYVFDGCYSVYRRRRHGRTALGISGHQLVGCLQNHDQIGNRCQGDRTSQLLTKGQLDIAACMVLTSPFVPLLFQGEEWGASTPFQYFTDHQDPELGAAVKKGRTEEFMAFGWDPGQIPDPQAESTFLRSKLKWDELGKPPHNRLLDWHRTLIGCRRRSKSLCDGRLDRLDVTFDETRQWLIMTRGAVSTICNFADMPQRIRHDFVSLSPQVIAPPSDCSPSLSGDEIIMPSQSAAILCLSNRQP